MGSSQSSHAADGSASSAGKKTSTFPSTNEPSSGVRGRKSQYTEAPHGLAGSLVSEPSAFALVEDPSGEVEEEVDAAISYDVEEEEEEEEVVVEAAEGGDNEPLLTDESSYDDEEEDSEDEEEGKSAAQCISLWRVPYLTPASF